MRLLVFGFLPIVLPCLFGFTVLSWQILGVFFFENRKTINYREKQSCSYWHCFEFIALIKTAGHLAYIFQYTMRMFQFKLLCMRLFRANLFYFEQIIIMRCKLMTIRHLKHISGRYNNNLFINQFNYRKKITLWHPFKYHTCIKIRKIFFSQISD